MTAHTEGPWSVADYDQGDQDDGWRTVMAHGRIVANVNPESFCGVEGGFVDMPADANARLIAAAPDLLEALREMCAMWRSVCSSQGWEPEHFAEAVRAQAAIARATGEQP